MTSTNINPVHWFYRKKDSTDNDWQPFSKYDSNNLEDVFQSTKDAVKNLRYHTSKIGDDLNFDADYSSKDISNESIVPTNGGRYDVYINSRCRKAIYWAESDSLVLRATWFYRPGNRINYIPFNEDAASLLESTYQECLRTGHWNQKIIIPTGDTVIFHNSKVFSHYEADQAPFTDEWSNITDNLSKPGKVWRGVQDLSFEDGETEAVDHLIFVIHGIGEVCDLRMRSLIEVVDDFRRLTNNLVKTHLAEDGKTLGRIEYIPISWHAALHGDNTGIDSRLNLITINSIPKLRHFSNDTILDALFYTSPVYCQIIINTVGNELNNVHKLFTQRNPSFNGTISLMGHSLGSLIIFDILSNQETSPSQDVVMKTDENVQNKTTIQYQSLDEIFDYLDLTEYVDVFKAEKIDLSALFSLNDNHLIQLGLEMGPRIKLLKFIQDHVDSHHSSNKPVIMEELKASISNQPQMNYPQLTFHTTCFFALGSPVSAFLTVRGVMSLANDDLCLPACDQVYNIFHPFDPIAYRLEPLIDEHFHTIPPCQIPHHKGRKRMHLELKENLIKMGTDLKDKVYNSLKPVWESLYGLKRVRSFSSFVENQDTVPTTPSTSSAGREDASMTDAIVSGRDLVNDDEESRLTDQNKMIDLSNLNHPCYKFNSTGRVDYVLQEAPIEFFNGYIFALATHTCYWQSEDTALFVLRSIYKIKSQ